MKYLAMYDCPICKARFSLPNSKPTEISYDELPVMLGKVMSGQQFRSNPYLASSIPPLEVPHKCDDESAGLARFIGFVRV